MTPRNFNNCLKGYSERQEQILINQSILAFWFRMRFAKNKKRISATDFYNPKKNKRLDWDSPDREAIRKKNEAEWAEFHADIASGKRKWREFDPKTMKIKDPNLIIN